MEFREIQIKPDNPIEHNIFCTQMPSVDYLDVLMMKFSGEYGYGSDGNGDAEYMTAITLAAISFTEPFGIIFDFTDLSYQWGDMMGQVICSGSDRWSDEEIPFVVVVSEKCKEAITSLIEDELLIKNHNLIHENIESALTYIDNENKHD